jgi:hypothetical protein
VCEDRAGFVRKASRLDGLVIPIPINVQPPGRKMDKVYRPFPTTVKATASRKANFVPNTTIS